MKKEKIIQITLEDLIKTREAKCERCGRKDILTIDHIIPMNILKLLGFTLKEMYEDTENLAILCRPCNSLKSGNLDFADERTKKLLYKYLERL